MCAIRPASWRTSRGSARAFTPGPRSWSSTIRTTRRRPSSISAFFEEIVALAKKYRFFVIHDFAYGDIGFRRLPAAELPCRSRGPRASAASSRRCPRATTWPAGGSGFAAGNRDMLGRSRRSRATTTTGSSRPSRSRRSWPCGTAKTARLAQVAEYQTPARRPGSRPQAAGLGPADPHGGHVRLDADARALAVANRLDRLRHEAPRGCQRGRQSRRGFGETGEGFLRLALVENAQRLRQAVRQIARCLRTEKAAIE